MGVHVGLNPLVAADREIRGDVLLDPTPRRPGWPPARSASTCTLVNAGQYSAGRKCTIDCLTPVPWMSSSCSHPQDPLNVALVRGQLERRLRGRLVVDRFGEGDDHRGGHPDGGAAGDLNEARMVLSGLTVVNVPVKGDLRAGRIHVDAVDRVGGVVGQPRTRESRSPGPRTARRRQPSRCRRPP